MKLWLPTRDRWRKPPVGLVRIDWSHPLARGLSYAWLLNEGAGPAVDLVKGTSAPLSVMTWGADSLVGVVNINSRARTITNVVLSGDFSMVSSGKHLNATNWLTVGLCGTSTTASTLGFFCCLQRTNVPQDQMQIHVGTGNYQTGNLGWFYGIRKSYGFSYATATGAVRAYIDGNYISGGNTQAAVTTNHTLNIGETVNGNEENWCGNIYYLYLYSRKLPDDDFRWVHAEPYAFLQPIRSRAYFIAAGGTQSESYSATGGALAGGAPSTVFSCTPSISGGALAGGSASVVFSFQPTISGGSVSGGSSSYCSGVVCSSSAGALVGGSASLSSGVAQQTTGGAVAGSSSTALFSRTTFTASAGGIAGGEVTPVWVGPVAASYDMSGGALAGATADLLFVRTTFTASGGGIAGGTATITLPSAETTAEPTRRAAPLPWPVRDSKKKPRRKDESGRHLRINKW